MYVITFGVCLFLIGITGWDISSKWVKYYMNRIYTSINGIEYMYVTEDTLAGYSTWVDREQVFHGVSVLSILYLCTALTVEVLL